MYDIRRLWKGCMQIPLYFFNFFPLFLPCPNVLKLKNTQIKCCQENGRIPLLRLRIAASPVLRKPFFLPICRWRGILSFCFFAIFLFIYFFQLFYPENRSIFEFQVVFWKKRRNLSGVCPARFPFPVCFFFLQLDFSSV